MLENIQDITNLIGIITGSSPAASSIIPLGQTKLNDTNTEFFAGQKGLFFLRFRATDFIGDVMCCLLESPILFLESAPSIDSGEIYVICDYYSTMGITSDSGTITAEGFIYSPNPPSQMQFKNARSIHHPLKSARMINNINQYKLNLFKSKTQS